MREGTRNVNSQPGSPGLLNGIYSYQEAARLLNVTVQRVARWADGYVFPRKSGYGVSGPILQSDRHRGVLSFPELFELFFVREYVGLGVRLPNIRTTAENLARDFGPYPFSMADLIVSGHELLLRSAEDVLHRPDVGQIVADFAQDFSKSVEFREGRAAQYIPPGFQGKIYLDKDIRAGEAVVTPHAIPTRSIYALWEHERDLLSVAEYHDIAVSDVSMAVRYEGQWRLAA